MNGQFKKKREEILKERQNFQREKELWDKLFFEQKTRLEQEIDFFKQYNQNQENRNIKSNEEQRISQLQRNYKNKDIKSQIDSLKNLYELKLKTLTDKKNIFKKEDEEFKKYKEDINNNTEIKMLELEQKNLELIKQNSEINQRENNIKNKEMYLKDKYEDYLRIKSIVESKEKNNIKNEQDLKLAAKRLDTYTDEIFNKENYIEKEKAELLKKSNEVKEYQKILEEENMDLEHEKTELNLRYQNLNSFSYQSPNMFMNNNEQINIGNNNDAYDTYLNNENNFEKYNYDKKFIEEGNYSKFNANRYIKAVKDRIENGKRIRFDNYKINGNRKKFDIANERLYINKCKNELNKNKYEYK